jgi:hypothetical protein
MCGLAGWNLTETPSKEFVLTLMSFIEDRGRDSYGFYNGETKEVYKGLGAITSKLPASKLLFKHGFFHTRHATTGATSVENSHPYQIGDVLGAHNGVIHNHKEMSEKYNRKFPVDSMHIFAHIAEGLDLKELEGYGAIEYTRNGEYFVGACNHGALEIALTDKGVIWSSTADSIDAAIFQGGLTLIHYFRVDNGAIYHVETDSLYDTDHTFKMREHFYPPSAPYFPSASTTGIRAGDDKARFGGHPSGSSDTMQEWERAMEREEARYERTELGSDVPDIHSMDWCHWCGKFAECVSLDDGSVGCYECAELWDEMKDEERAANPDEVLERNADGETCLRCNRIAMCCTCDIRAIDYGRKKFEPEGIQRDETIPF